MSRWLLASCLFFPILAQAQWPTTEWNVYCTDEAFPYLGEEACDDSVPDSPANLAKTQLQGASVWLSAQEFQSPRAGLRTGQVYEAWIGERSEIPGFEAWGGLGWYEDNWRVMLNREYWNAEPDAGGYGSYLAERLPFSFEAIHVLFNAVQHSHQPRDVVASDELGWIIHGLAELVTLYWYQEIEGADFITPPFFLSDPLHMPRDRHAGYDAYFFWAYLNELLCCGTPYLRDVFDALEDVDHGITGVNDALKGYDSEGLFNLYPEIIARFGDDLMHYDDDRAALLVDTLDLGSLPVLERSTTGDVNPVATNALDITIDSDPGEPVGVTVKLEPQVDDLHLIVNGERVDDRSRGATYNVYETILEGGTEELLRIRIANIADEPVDSEEWPYEVTIRLERMDPCNSNWLAAALNPFSAEGRAEVSLAKSRWDAMELQDERNVGITTLGQAQYTFNGDGGVACVSFFGVSDLEWIEDRDPNPDPVGDLERIVRENMPRITRETGLTEAQVWMLLEGDTPAGVTPAQMMRAMQIAQEIAQEPQSASPAQSGVLFHIFEPNLITALGGIAPESVVNKDGVATRHNGLGGWRPNSASNLIVYLPGTQASEIEAGGTYNAVAYSISDDPSYTIPEGPETNSAFYTWWNGDWKSYRCDGRRTEDFEGTVETIWGQLSGTVRIESVSPTVVRGSFDLAGSGKQETVRYSVERTHFTNCPWEPEVEEDIADGIAISASGSFTAPNFPPDAGSWGLAGGAGRAVRVGR